MSIPDLSDTSPGNQIHYQIFSYLQAVETMAGINPPNASRLYFIMGCLYWNSYAVMDPLFPFIDGFEAPRCPISPSSTPDQRFQFYCQLIKVCFAGLQAHFVPGLPPIVLAPGNNPVFPYINDEFPQYVETYLQSRLNDGYTASLSRPFSYANSGYYIECDDPSAVTPQDLNAILPQPSQWAPLKTFYPSAPTKSQSPLLPYFSTVRNWLSDEEIDAMLVIAAKSYPSPSLFDAQVTALHNQSDGLTDSERCKAEIWAGATPGYATPPGKLIIFLVLLLASQSYPLKESVAIIGGVTFALFHAGICAWKVKYIYMQVRPIQTFREVFLNQNILFPITGTIGNGGFWLPYQPSTLYTPPFPDYISGHSTFSMAVATMLTTLLKNDTIPIYQTIDPSYFHILADILSCIERPATLQNLMLPPLCSKLNDARPTIPVLMNWTTWSGLANEIGISRIYGLIHWHNSNLGGLAVGEWVAEQILQKIDWTSLDLHF